MINQSLW